MEIITEYFTGLTDKQKKQFAALKNLYEEWNQKINVISRKDMDNFYLHHVLHSLAIAARFNFPAGYQVMDLGTGGGFPGVPLAIFFPSVHFQLVDSIQKKLKVVAAVASNIGLKNITTQHARVEDLQNKKAPVTAARYDVIVSRAVAPLKDLWSWSIPLLKKPVNTEPTQGLICLKGGDLKDEIAKCGCTCRVWPIENVFKEMFFKDKYLLSVSR
jgi:16S rRNA (guanine527-N7)-methyltransferase